MFESLFSITSPACFSGTIYKQYTYGLLKVAALPAYESVFIGDQATLLDKYNAKDRYVGSLVGVQYAEAFRSRGPLLVPGPEVFMKARFG